MEIIKRIVIATGTQAPPSVRRSNGMGIFDCAGLCWYIRDVSGDPGGSSGLHAILETPPPGLQVVFGAVTR
jgi:hypothetical protein